jgi:hypothetical protein
MANKSDLNYPHLHIAVASSTALACLQTDRCEPQLARKGTALLLPVSRILVLTHLKSRKE